MRPAARKFDLTVHGGAIVQGASMVLTEGQPAARVSDMTICPLSPPVVPPPPHVGGPIIGPGAGMVFIEGLPAARLGDAAICAGGGAIIISGAAKTFIGG